MLIQFFARARGGYAKKLVPIASESRMGLRAKERRFCEQHGIPLGKLWDAAGLPPRHYSPAMKKRRKWAAYGVTECHRGHRLRDRHGSCLMCDTAKVAYLLRAKQSGLIYVAVGGGGCIAKVGLSTDPDNRIKIANYIEWGGFSDWRIILTVHSNRAGRDEISLHKALRDFAFPLQWERGGVWRTTREAYVYEMDEIISAVVRVCDGIPDIRF